jgi:RNA polymerase sigma factor (sigma-70 family)
VSDSPAFDESATDDCLIGLAQSGNRAAFAMLYARHTPSLWAVARQMGMDEATSADLVQVAWMRLIERYDSVTGFGSVRPWLKQVVRNDARKFHSRGNRPIPVDDRVIQDVPPEQQAVDDDERDRVRAAFGQLDARCQELLRITLFTEPALSYDDLAEVTGMARGSIGPTRKRCLQKLEDLLNHVSRTSPSDER